MKNKQRITDLRRSLSLCFSKLYAAQSDIDALQRRLAFLEQQAVNAPKQVLGGSFTVGPISPEVSYTTDIRKLGTIGTQWGSAVSTCENPMAGASIG